MPRFNVGVLVSPVIEVTVQAENVDIAKVLAVQQAELQLLSKQWISVSTEISWIDKHGEEMNE